MWSGRHCTFNKKRSYMSYGAFSVHGDHKEASWSWELPTSYCIFKRRSDGPSIHCSLFVPVVFLTNSPPSKLPKTHGSCIGGGPWDGVPISSESSQKLVSPVCSVLPSLLFRQYHLRHGHFKKFACGNIYIHMCTACVYAAYASAQACACVYICAYRHIPCLYP